MKTTSRWLELGLQVLAILLAIGFTSLVLLTAGAAPFDAYGQILQGAFGSLTGFADVLVAWVPLLIATAGLLFTYTAGLWNIGVEGQITLGAIFTTGALRLLQNTSMAPGLIILLGILAGALGGALWAALAGGLRTFGNVNEIFGGLGLNFVATALAVWLVFGPWKRPGIGSMSGTEPFPDRLALPQLAGLRLSPWALALGLLAVVVAFFLLKNTTFGLRLKAVGRNRRSAFLMGVPTTQMMMVAFLVCGAFAGLAGSLQVVAVYHRLIPTISSGYGFLGMLVAMLINFQPAWVAPVSFFFAALNIGGIQLPIVLKLDSTLSGVLEEALVLFVLLGEGARRRLFAFRTDEGSHG